jgi:hypothetical protein
MATYSVSSIGFAFNVTSVAQVKFVPEYKAVVNRFDEHGDLLSLDRLPEESNVDFRARMLDVSVHLGGPTYEGLVNNLARELGLPRLNAMTIDLKVDSAGAVVATNPRADILADRVVLYENWQDIDTYTIEKEIHFYDIDSEGYRLDDLIAAINTSDYFTATRFADVRPNMLSVNLLRGTTLNRSLAEEVQSIRQNHLDNQNIVTSSLWFRETDIFATEVYVEPTAAGEYYIDYTNGFVISYDIPQGDNICGYIWNEFPWVVDSSLVHVYSLQDENFTNKLFRAETTDAGTAYGLPNAEGAEIYHQLFTETNVFWGE